jgi:translocation and assembly module TamB
MQGGAILAQQIGGRVGIQDVSIEPTSATSNDTSLVLGRYLSPRFYVSYGISLAEAINTLKLRYTIGDHWTIKTEAGKARSADIVYTVRNPRLGKKKPKATAAPKVPAPAASVAP